LGGAFQLLQGSVGVVTPFGNDFFLPHSFHPNIFLSPTLGPHVAIECLFNIKCRYRYRYRYSVQKFRSSSATSLGGSNVLGFKKVTTNLKHSIPGRKWNLNLCVTKWLNKEIYTNGYFRSHF
jgi:hypothetical protein